MPTPIIDLQRRLTIVGAIRVGGEKKPKSPGAKLESFRLTTPRKELIEQAAGLYGGKPQPWEGPNGAEWQLYTDAPLLPVLVMPHYSLTQRYELWEGATQLVRVCDGIEMADGARCQCNAEGIDKCDIYTRLVVALPELDTVLGWRLITRGANAAHELPTMMQFIEHTGSGQAFVPARLVLDQRRGVKDGQVVRYVVPTLDLQRGYGALVANARPQLPAAPDANQVVEGAVRPAVPDAAAPATAGSADAAAALDAVTGAPVERASGGPRDAAPLPTAQFDPEPMPQAPADDAPPFGGYAGDELPQTKRLTNAQATKLNVLVGGMRDAKLITTEHLWLSVAQRLREVEASALIEELGGRDSDGVLHWSPLRETLTRAEAGQLIDWLEELERKVGAPA